MAAVSVEEGSVEAGAGPLLSHRPPMTSVRQLHKRSRPSKTEALFPPQPVSVESERSEVVVGAWGWNMESGGGGLSGANKALCLPAAFA